MNRQESFWVQSPETQERKTFSNELIKTIGVLDTSVRCNDWAAVDVIVTVVEDGHRPIIGRDLSFFSLDYLSHNLNNSRMLIKSNV